MEHEPVSKVHNFLGVLVVSTLLLRPPSFPSQPFPVWLVVRWGSAVFAGCFKGETPLERWYNSTLWEIIHSFYLPRLDNPCTDRAT